MGVVEEEAGKMVPVEGKQKALGVVWMIVVLREQVEAEAGVGLVESLVGAEVLKMLNQQIMFCIHFVNNLVCSKYTVVTSLYF